MPLVKDVQAVVPYHMRFLHGTREEWWPQGLVRIVVEYSIILHMDGRKLQPNLYDVFP